MSRLVSHDELYAPSVTLEFKGIEVKVKGTTLVSEAIASLGTWAMAYVDEISTPGRQPPQFAVTGTPGGKNTFARRIDGK